MSEGKQKSMMGRGRKGNAFTMPRHLTENTVLLVNGGQ